MKKIVGFAKRYRSFLFMLAINIVIMIIWPTIGKQTIHITALNIKEMLMVIPPIFILLGLMDVWVEKETMMKYMGDDSGILGAILAFMMGAMAAGPLYAAFPIAGILLKKGVRLFNVFLFIGAWSTAKIPLLMFEATNMGVRYMLIRLVCNLVGIIFIAFLLEKTTSDKKKEEIYQLNGNI